MAGVRNRDLSVTCANRIVIGLERTSAGETTNSVNEPRSSRSRRRTARAILVQLPRNAWIRALSDNSLGLDRCPRRGGMREIVRERAFIYIGERDQKRRYLLAR